MASAIKELLGKEAHELTDEELADLIRGNRPRPAEPRTPKASNGKKFADLSGLGDLFDDDDADDDDLLDLSLDEAEAK